MHRSRRSRSSRAVSEAIKRESSADSLTCWVTDKKVGFEGIRLRMATSNLPEDAFHSIGAGEVVEVTFDAAELHDLTAGGDFNLVADGTLSYEVAGELTGVVAYSSNTITAQVNGEQAAQSRKAFVNKRSAVQSDCTGSRGTATRNALSSCRTLANAAASAARSNTAKLQEYFKSTSVGSQVASVFTKVASECGSTTSGVSRTYCSDVYSACSSGVLAYTLPSASYIVNCPLYFNELPALSRQCHAQDQATTTLHEATHLSQIAGTDDLGYGYSAARGLTTKQALNNADSYALFANAIYAGC